MAKVDIKHAFRLCPVLPQDFLLLGMLWDGLFYFDTRLPFGGRSSPFIFNSFADALAWILVFVCGIPYILYYLDDFFVASHCGNNFCSSYVQLVKVAFDHLGVPIADDKLEGPVTRLTYLGIEIDSDVMVIRLPEEKLFELWYLLEVWVVKHKCTNRELLCLIGKLSFAAKVVKPSRLFVRRLIDLSTTVKRLNHHISVNSESREDILWWQKFILTWNSAMLSSRVLL